MTKTRTFTSDHINISDRWAIRFFKWNDTESECVLFYDRKYADPRNEGWEKGQPVYSYYVTTLTERTGNYPLCLDTAIPEWTVPAEDMAEVYRLCRERL